MRASPALHVRKETAARSRLLHPGIWFVAIWSATLAIWGGLPADTFERITGAERQVSAVGVAYLSLALAAFTLGTFLGPSFLTTRRRVGQARSAAALEPQRAVRTIAWMTVIALVLGGAALVYIIVHGIAQAGGPAAIADQIKAGVSWAHLAERYFIPSRIHGLTIWVQLNAAVAVLATMGLAMNPERAAVKRILVAALIAGFLLSVVQSFALNDRLSTAEYVVAAFVAFVGYRAVNRQPILTRSVLCWVGGTLIILISLWMAGEYARTYLARYGPALTDAQGNRIDPPAQSTSAGGFAGERFIAYLVSSPNNAMYAVENFEHYTYVYRSGKGLFTATSMDTYQAPIFGPGIEEATAMLSDFYRTPEYTVYSFPGYAYTDLSWGGLLVCLWFGLIIGAVHQRFAAVDLWALLVYPFLFVGVLDSWRIFYWSESRMLVPVAFLLLTAFLATERLAKARATSLSAGRPALEAP